MAFVLFVGGLLDFNSGKTTIAKDMISVFKKELDLNLTPYKPLSGNNFYYHYDQIKENLEKYKQFVSLDIVDLLSFSSTKSSIELHNPVHRVHTQALPYMFSKEGSLRTFYTKYAKSNDLFQRFSLCKSEDKIDTVFIVNEPIYTNQKFWNDISIADPIIKGSKDVRTYKNEHEYHSLNNQFYAEATESAFNCLKEKYPILLIESFNNSAHPAWCIRESNVIALVGPGSLFIYEADVYFRAIDNFRSINRNKPTTTEDILQLATPDESCSLSLDAGKRAKEIKKITLETYESFK